MTERTRKHPIQFYLSDDEQYILDEKFRLSKMRSNTITLHTLKPNDTISPHGF